MTRGTPSPEVTPAMYLELFEHHPTGRLVLADLVKLFCRRPDPNDFSQEGMLRGFVRTHQREVVEHVLRQINRAQGVPEPQGEDDGR